MGVRVEKHDIGSKNTEHTLLESVIARFGERLTTVINGEPYKSFASKCGMSDKAIRDYVNGKTYPALDKIAQIAKATGCSFEWLATGSTIEGVTEKNLSPVSDKTRATATPEQQQAWLAILDRMTDHEREAIIDRVFRQGIGVLLGVVQLEQQATQSKLSLPNDLPERLGISHDGMAMGMLYDSLPNKDRQKILADIAMQQLLASGHEPSDKQAG